MNTKISIIIRCYNEGKYLDRLLKSIKSQTYKNHETIIVDSESTDDTVKIIQNYDINYIKIKKTDFTFGYALNVGCKLATGEIFVIISAHAYPLNQFWLEKLVKPFIDEKVAVVYGKQRGNYCNKFSEHMIFQAWFPETNNRAENNPFCNNAHCSIRKSCWQKYLYDEKISGLEDIALATKFVQDGYFVQYNSDAILIHIHEKKTGQIYHRYFREAQAIKQVMPFMEYSIFDFVVHLLSNIFIDIVQAIKEKVFFKNLIDIVQMRFLQFYGTYIGYRTSPNKRKERILKKIFYNPPSIKKLSLYEHLARK